MELDLRGDSFLPKKIPKIISFCFLILSFDLIENDFKIKVRNFLSDNPYPVSGEIFVHELCVKTLLANQIAGFLKVQFLEKEVRYEAGLLYVVRLLQKHPTDFDISNGYDMSKNLSHLPKHFKLMNQQYLMNE